MAVPEHSIYYLEIVTPNVEAAVELYSKAYGWRFEAKGPEWGNPFVATLPGGRVSPKATRGPNPPPCAR